MLLSPLGIWMHSGMITRMVSFESKVKIPWNSPISRLDSERPEKHPVKVCKHSRRFAHACEWSAGSIDIAAPVS